MTTTEALRLRIFSISGLFGEFDHKIPLSPTSHVTALIAPNGRGKTACLRLINALFRRHWSVFSSTEFIELTYHFSNDSAITIRHLPSDVNIEERRVGIEIVTQIGGTSELWSPKFSITPNSRLMRIEQYIPFLTRVSPTTWIHDYTRQTFNVQEVLESFSDQLPDGVIESLSEKPPPALTSIIDQIDCHLIETQRLLIIQEDASRRTASTNLTISKKAQTLKEVIARELTNYASLSQSLDSSFPRRVIQRGGVQPAQNLPSDLQELDQNRRRLMDAGILDTEEDEPLLPGGEISQQIAAVLSVYVQDTKRKLDSLSSILQKITLFKELIDDRFNPKHVVVNRTVGFAVKRGANSEVPLEKLSSGEQHQLVLFFELLFELKNNALILIDEPELSLHVAWQKKFIPDMLRIIKTNSFDVLLATHSPQLIGRWTDLVVELGDVEAS